ncbi:hypothetical protein BgiMline_032659 [Biomphalaria glabrata]|nr:hypothetical protein BgiMline_015672 [Biomphalaria glabrata]
MTDQQIKEERWTLTRLSAAINTKENCLAWLAKRRLIRNTYDCIICHQPATLVAYAQGIDGFRWSCRGCDFRKSVRDDSFFSGSHIALEQLLQLIYCWCYDMPQFNIIHETNISCKTIIDWCNFCRDECENYIERHGLLEIGGIDENGDPIVVEIDETKYFHRKYHRGQWREGHWVFGGVERLSKKCFLVEVPDRTAATLTQAITQHILPGTHIVSDGWAAYANIANINNGVYSHSVVIHQDNFVDPNDSDTHTQNIENMWMRAKRKLKHQFGTSNGLFHSYLNEFMFRTALGHKHIFCELLVGITECYPMH